MHGFNGIRCHERSTVCAPPVHPLSAPSSAEAGCWPPPQLPKSPSAQIFLDGVLQEATLDPKCADQPTCGGSLVVNGISVVVPNNAMVFFPANALTWQEMFTGGSSGLAASDKPAGGPYIVRWAHTA